jgi:hypothetical protein
VRRVQCGRGSGANAKTYQSQCKYPNARKIHPASVLSPIGVSCCLSFTQRHIPSCHFWNGSPRLVRRVNSVRHTNRLLHKLIAIIVADQADTDLVAPGISTIVTLVLVELY